MKEDTWVAICEWCDGKPKWINSPIGFYMFWSHRGNWSWLFGKYSIGDYDLFSHHWWHSWYILKREIYLPPAWLARIITHLLVAQCRYRGHKDRDGTSRISYGCSCCCCEPESICLYCGDDCT